MWDISDKVPRIDLYYRSVLIDDANQFAASQLHLFEVVYFLQNPARMNPIITYTFLAFLDLLKFEYIPKYLVCLPFIILK